MSPPVRWKVLAAASSTAAGGASATNRRASLVAMNARSPDDGRASSAAARLRRRRVSKVLAKHDLVAIDVHQRVKHEDAVVLPAAVDALVVIVQPVRTLATSMTSFWV